MSNTKPAALSFDARTVAPQEAFTIIPAGWYNATVEDGELKATKGRNGGTGLNITYAVLDGPYKGRKVFGFINVKNASAQAQEIGQRELSALCHATGVLDVSTDKSFNGKQLQIKVGVEEPSEEEKKKGREDRNTVKGYKAIEGGNIGAPAFIPGGPAAPGPVAGPPAIPSAPAPVAPAPVADVFPPEGWTAHPQAPGYFYCGQDVKAEAELRAMFPPAPAPVAAPIPAPAPALPPAPVAAAPALPPAPAPVAAPVGPLGFPPADWFPHPQAPGHFYNAAGECLTEADLKARLGIGGAPAAPGGDTPPWKR